ncbi:MAG: hypothetical protein AAGM46_06650 [Cyanobacteria bacterium J06582_2]
MPSSEVTKYLFSNSRQVFQQFVNECLPAWTQNRLDANLSFVLVEQDKIHAALRIALSIGMSEALPSPSYGQLIAKQQRDLRLNRRSPSVSIKR